MASKVLPFRRPVPAAPHRPPLQLVRTSAVGSAPQGRPAPGKIAVYLPANENLYIGQLRELRHLPRELLRLAVCLAVLGGLAAFLFGLQR